MTNPNKLLSQASDKSYLVYSQKYDSSVPELIIEDKSLTEAIDACWLMSVGTDDDKFFVVGKESRFHHYERGVHKS